MNTAGSDYKLLKDSTIRIDIDMRDTNAPVYGCELCRTTGGRMSCWKHGYKFFNIAQEVVRAYSPGGIQQNVIYEGQR